MLDCEFGIPPENQDSEILDLYLLSSLKSNQFHNIQLVVRCLLRHRRVLSCNSIDCVGMARLHLDWLNGIRHDSIISVNGYLTFNRFLKANQKNKTQD